MLKHPPLTCALAVHQQQGVSLVEALVALLLVALGVLGMLGMQLNVLAETRNSTQRAQALRIIEDLSERVKSNPSRYAVLSTYVLSNWNEEFGRAATANCSTHVCSADQQAAWDIHVWRRNVPLAMPGAQALTFLSQSETDTANRRQLGVLLAWRVNERAQSAADAAFTTPFVIAEGASDAVIACPVNMICHLAYIQP